MTSAHDPGASTDWLGLPGRISQPTCRAAIPKGQPSAPLGPLLNHHGTAVAREPTEVWLWYDRDALHLKARCHTAAMDRVRTLAARTAPYARDAWGDDAFELHLDVGRTLRRHRHFILPPNGRAITFTGQDYRDEQGWHPSFAWRVEFEENAWVIEAQFPFAIFGGAPADGETWGGNVLRVNPSESTGYVQWAPTFGNALRTALFGEFQFAGTPGNRAGEIAAYARRAAERTGLFLTTINGVQETDALRALGVADWTAWGRYLKDRTGPVPVRWEECQPGRAGIPGREREMVMEMADALVGQIAGWPLDPPEPAALSIEPLEVLGDAWLLTGDRRYVAAFEQALRVHARLLRQITATVTDPDPPLHHRRNPYFDAQIIRAEMLAYAYLTLRDAGLTPATHATMMTDVVLRGGRFAAFNISSHYTYGNHQVYESAGLAAVAALFPELPESADWAGIASRAIRLHLEREVYPDGGWRERCGYHSVAMSYAMHAVATIRANHLEHRFAGLMDPGTLAILERMHEWVLWMMAPDGSLPAFGDYGAYPQLRFLQRGAALFARPEFAWPLRQLAPAMVPPGLEPRQPDRQSVSLDSQFTVLRDGWTPAAFYLAVDHGPIGGQHSHLDTLGFVAYAHGRPVALDTGIGTSYEDARYKRWFRTLRAHNVIALDDLEPEKVADRTFWKPGNRVDIVGMRSRAFEHALGVRHERVVFFVKGLGWLIHDRLDAPESVDLGAHRIDWMLHTPYRLAAESPGVLHAAEDGGGLLVLAGRAGDLEPPVLELMPASVTPREAVDMRLWDLVRRFGGTLTPNITSLAWRKKPVAGNTCEFATLLLPYRGARPRAELAPTSDGWVLRVNGQTSVTFRTKGEPAAIVTPSS